MTTEVGLTYETIDRMVTEGRTVVVPTEVTGRLLGR